MMPISDTTTRTRPPEPKETPVTVGADPLPADRHTDGPDPGRAFDHWPVPVGRAKVRDGLTFVFSPDPGGFTADDHRRIPAADRAELLDGVLVVSPDPGPAHRRAAAAVQAALDAACPHGTAAFLGPLGLPLGPAAVLEPDVQVPPAGGDPAPVVVEVLAECGRFYDLRVKRRRYQAAGVPAYWIVDPDAPSITILDLDDAGRYRRTAVHTGGGLCAVDRPFPVRLRLPDATPTRP
jgi:Uma2 family endonuclease